MKLLLYASIIILSGASVATVVYAHHSRRLKRLKLLGFSWIGLSTIIIYALGFSLLRVALHLVILMGLVALGGSGVGRRFYRQSRDG